jgi:hypothetical protein
MVISLTARPVTVQVDRRKAWIDAARRQTSATRAARDGQPLGARAAGAARLEAAMAQGQLAIDECLRSSGACPALCSNV